MNAEGRSRLLEFCKWDPRKQSQNWVSAIEVWEPWFREGATIKDFTDFEGSVELVETASNLALALNQGKSIIVSAENGRSSVRFIFAIEAVVRELYDHDGLVLTFNSRDQRVELRLLS